MIADSESDESITMELDPKLLLLPMVRLNRLKTVDPSVILGERTRTKDIKCVKRQLDTRDRKQIKRDDKVMRFVGEETRVGFQHNKKTAIRLKKQATWQEKRRKQIREWEEASRREEEAIARAEELTRQRPTTPNISILRQLLTSAVSGKLQ